MNYLRKKLQGLMACADFKGYLREATGYPLTLTDCMGSDLVSLSVTGNAVQDGTPSPDNPVEVQGCGEATENGYKVPISVSGNLFDVSQLVSNSGGYVQDGTVYITGYPYNTGITPEMFLEMTGLKEGDTFSACADYEQIATPVTGAMYSNFTHRNSASQELSDVLIINYQGKFTTTTIPNGFNSDNYNNLYMYGGVVSSEISEDAYAIYSNIRVYKGTYTAETMPPYEPYHAPQTVNIYTDKPLYGRNGEAWSEIVFDGTEGWYTTTAATDGKINYFIVGPTLNSNNTGPKKSACSHFEWSSSRNAVLTDLNTHKVYGFSNYSCWIGVCVSVSDYPTVDDWKAFLQAQYAAGTPLKLYVATEDSASAETITPTYKGTTVLSAATTVQPSSMTAKYYATKEG